MLKLVPPEWKTLSTDTRIQLTELKQAIRQTRTTTSPGCCGWTQPDLMCVPDCMLEKLIQLWNGFLDGQFPWPQNLHFAKIVTPKKKETTLSMMDVRPITILSLLYRVLSKTWTKKTSDTNCLLCTLAYPRLINASIFPGPVYVSTLRLEKSHAFKIPLCGVVSDLTKFFNTLQRKYLK